MLLPHKPPKIKPRDVRGAVIERGIPDPPCWRSLRDAIGVESLPGQAGFAAQARLWLSANPWVLPDVELAGEVTLSLGIEHHLMHPSKHRQGHNMRAVVQFGQNLFRSK